MVKWTMAMLAAAVVTLKETVDGLEHEQQQTRREVGYIKKEVKKGRTLRKKVKKKKKAAKKAKPTENQREVSSASCLVPKKTAKKMVQKVPREKKVQVLDPVALERRKFRLNEARLNALAAYRTAKYMAREQLISDGRTVQEIKKVEDRGMLYDMSIKIQSQIKDGSYIIPPHLHRSKYIPDVKRLMSYYKPSTNIAEETSAKEVTAPTVAVKPDGGTNTEDMCGSGSDSYSSSSSDSD